MCWLAVVLLPRAGCVSVGVVHASGLPNTGGSFGGKNVLYPRKISIWLLTFFSLKSVERTDSGKYWCQVENGGKKEESQQVWLIVEGKE